MSGLDPYTRAGVNSARASAERAIRALDLVDDVDDRWLALCRQVDPARVVRNLTTEDLTGVDREVTIELDRRRPRTMPNSAIVPWETFALRAQQAAMTRANLVGGNAGPLVETVNFPSAAGALLSLLILGKVGATAINSTANLNMPKVNSSASTFWLGTETTSISETDEAFGQISFSPKTVGGYVEMSRLLVLQSSPDAADTVALDLVRKVKRAVEAAAFSGTGTNGQPLGLTKVAGTNAVSGTSFSLATAQTAVGGIGDALDVDSNPGWAAARSVALTLRQRVEFPNTGFRTIWGGPATYGTLADYDAAASSGVPSATAIFGAWKFLYLVDFQGGLEISINPFGSNANGGNSDAANFQKGLIGMRVMSTLDIAPVWPSAFSIVSNVT